MGNVDILFTNPPFGSKIPVTDPAILENYDLGHTWTYDKATDRWKKTGAVLYNGRDEVLAAGLLMGADGGIGTFYNLVPELFVELYNHTREQRWKEARAVQDRVNELIELTLRFPALSAVKKMLAWSGIDCGGSIGPRRPLTAEEERQLREALVAAGFTQFTAPQPRS